MLKVTRRGFDWVAGDLVSIMFSTILFTHLSSLIPRSSFFSRNKVSATRITAFKCAPSISLRMHAMVYSLLVDER